MIGAVSGKPEAHHEAIYLDAMRALNFALYGWA
jgi:hypothetical protein